VNQKIKINKREKKEKKGGGWLAADALRMLMNAITVRVHPAGSRQHNHHERNPLVTQPRTLPFRFPIFPSRNNHSMETLFPNFSISLFLLLF